MLKKAGVQVISINEPFEDTPTGRLMETIIESLDEFYSDNLGEEVTRGMRESAARGFYLSSKAPYGYRKIKVQDGDRERTKLELVSGEAGIVHDMYQGIISGRGLTETVRDLNAKGISGPRGKGWSKTGVYSMLTNEIYTGVFVWGKNSKRGNEPVRTENACPAIINRDTFLKAQNLMKEHMPKRIHPKRAASPFLLSGLAKCGYCGKALVGKYAKSGEFAYYVCGTLDKKGGGSCQAKYLNAGKFESLVITQIREHILTQKNLTKLVRMVNEETDSTVRSYDNELNAIDRAITDTNNRLEKLYEAIETGKLNLDDVVVRIRELRQRQEQSQARKTEIEGQIADRKVELADLETVSYYVADLHDLLKQGTLTERRSFIRDFVKEVKVYQERGGLELLCTRAT